MKTEKIVISFIATLIGILAAGGAFYFYQSTKVIPPEQAKTVSIIEPSNAPDTSSLFLGIDSPKDEEVINIRTVIISGKTLDSATIVITTHNNDQVITPSASGSFSTTAILVDGQNHIIITAIAPDGKETSITRTVTVSTESF